MFQTKLVEKIKTLLFENSAIYEIIWENIVEPVRPQMTIWCIACWIPKATNTPSE